MNKSLNILNDYYMYKRSYYPNTRIDTSPHSSGSFLFFYEFLVSSLTHPVYLKYQSVHNFSIQILHILFLFSAHSKINTHTYNISFWHWTQFLIRTLSWVGFGCTTIFLPMVAFTATFTVLYDTFLELNSLLLFNTHCWIKNYIMVCRKPPS